MQYELTRERYHVSIPALRAQVEAIGTVSMARANKATTALIGRGRNVGPTPPASKNGLRAVRADVIDLLAIAVEQRLRDIVEELIAISKVRGHGAGRAGAGRGQGGGRARAGQGAGRAGAGRGEGAGRAGAGQGEGGGSGQPNEGWDRVLTDPMPFRSPSSLFPLPSSLFLLPSSLFLLPSSLFPFSSPVQHRVELAKMGQEIEVTSNPKKQMWLIEKIRRDHAEVKAGIITPAQIAAAREQRDAAAAASTPRRPESLVMQHKVQLTNSTALKELGVRPRTTASPASAAGSTPDDDAGTPTPAAAATRQRRTRNPADQRKLTVRDLLFYLEHEPQSARSRMLARRYLLLRER